MFDLKQFKDKESLLLVLDIMFLISPGVMTIFVFDSALFLKLEWIKLILLSIAITTPFVFTNTAICDRIINPEDKSEKNKFFYTLSLATIVTGMMFYVVLFIFYEKPSLGNALLMIAILEAALSFIIYLDNKRVKNGRHEMVGDKKQQGIG